MVYNKQSWFNEPSVASPVNAARLSHLETQYDEAVVTAGAAVDAKVAAVTATSLGLGNVNNTSDANKPVSTDQQTALDGKADDSGITYGDAGKKYRMVSCCLRRVSTTVWAVLDDVDHAPSGVASVAIISAQHVRVTYDFTAAKVSSLQATVDDAFASSSGGVRVGASVGTSFTNLFFYIGASSTPIDPGTLTTAGGNVWVTGWFEVA